MNLVNIFNKGRLIYLFCRDKEGTLSVKEDDSFFPYYYERGEGDCKTIEGHSVKKLYVTHPRDIAKNRTSGAYEADVFLTKRYLIDKVNKIDEGMIKYAFIDIEVLTDELPDVTKAEFPVSCISIYNSMYKNVQTFYLPDYNNEWDMIKAFIDFMKTEQFDLWLSWHVKFDYNYLYNRFPDFSTNISSIGQNRYGDGEIFYPAGMSIIDYLEWFKKVTLNKEKSYALDAVAQKHFKENAWGKTDFGTINEHIREKNINDVLRMQKLEDKFGIIAYFDSIRRLSKVEWEDLIWNSRIIDMLLLEEAKNQKIVLPMKPKNNELETYEGAYREAYELGAHFGVGKYDLSSAYPLMVIDFCLDPSNAFQADDNPNMIKVEDTWFYQNQKALLPTIVKKLVDLKEKLKTELGSTDLKSTGYKPMKTKYNAVKSVVNSAYGVMGNRFFRLYDPRIASATTFLVRDLLHYVKDKIEEKGYKVIYVDTDSVMLANNTEDISSLLNEIVKDWAQKYGKDTISAEFAYEGYFDRLLILAKCRYAGYLQTSKGEEEEIKGIEAKRKDSTIYMQKFQRTFIDKILDKENKKDIFEWIKNEVTILPNQPLENVAFPCKLARQPKDYKNVPIFLRAMNETEGFKKKVGDNFFYIYVKPEYYYVENEVVDYYREVPGKREGSTKKEKILKRDIDKINLAKALADGDIKMQTRMQRIKKPKDVKAFDEDTACNIMDVDWVKMKDRNIYMKLITIFEAMKWDIMEVKL